MASHRDVAARRRSARMSWSSPPGAEIDRAESVRSELGQQCRAVGVADLPRHQDSIGRGELVAGGQDADRRARADEQRLDAEAREYPDVGGPEPRSRHKDLRTGRDVLAGFPYVRARAHRFFDEHGQRAILSPRVLHHAYCVGTGRHQRTGHYPHCLAARKGGLRPVAGRHGPGHPQADRGGSHISGLYGISVHCGIGEAGHGLGSLHRLGHDVPKRIAGSDAAWRQRRDRGQDKTTRLSNRDQRGHSQRFRAIAARSPGHKVPADLVQGPRPPTPAAMITSRGASAWPQRHSPAAEVSCRSPRCLRQAVCRRRARPGEPGLPGRPASR